MADQSNAERSASVESLPGFAEFTEAFCAGFSACRDGLTDKDGEAFMAGLMEAFHAAGRQRVRSSDGSYVGTRERAAAQAREWKELLHSLMEPPPFSRERKSAWRAGYDDALRDLAKLRAEGTRV